MDLRQRDALRRRYGYTSGPAREPALVRILTSAGFRLRTLGRGNAGHQIAACPGCRCTDALWIEPDGEMFTTTCGCWIGEGDAFALMTLVYRRPLRG